MASVSRFGCNIKRSGGGNGLCLDMVLSLYSEEPITFMCDAEGSGPLIFSAFSGTITTGPKTAPLLRDSQNCRCASGTFEQQVLTTKVARDVSHITEYVSGNPVRKF